jgi:hypothetical protein
VVPGRDFSGCDGTTAIVTLDARPSRSRHAHAVPASITPWRDQNGCDGTVLIGCPVDSTLTRYEQLTSGQDPKTKKYRA